MINIEEKIPVRNVLKNCSNNICKIHAAFVPVPSKAQGDKSIRRILLGSSRGKAGDAAADNLLLL
jgi:hypothetical protein